MKRQIYAISLLLSFLVVLSHELINHHHHDLKAIDLSLIHKQHEADDHHHGDKHHHHHDSAEDKKKQKNPKEEHNHSFPFHHHLSETNDFVLVRTNHTQSNSQYQINVLYLALEVLKSDVIEPINSTEKRYKDKSFLISSNYSPAANALRGPPSIV